MTPAQCGGTGVYMIGLSSTGNCGKGRVDLSSATYDEHIEYSKTRPVINLKSNVQIIRGNGTKNNPYVIKTN